MIMVERIAWALAVTGVLFRLLHWPMAGVLLILGFSLAAMLYFPLGWRLFGRTAPKGQLVPLSVVTGLVLGLLVIGMLFKLQLWPGAEFDLLVGLLGAVVVMAAIFTLHSRNPGIEHYFQGLRHRLLWIGIPALLLYLVPTPQLIAFFHRDDPQRGALLQRLYEAPGDSTAVRELKELDEQRPVR